MIVPVIELEDGELGIEIPQEYIDKLGLKEGMIVDWELREDCAVMTFRNPE